MPNVSGTIYRYGTNERVQGAVVRALSRDGKTKFAVTDDDGDFTIEDLEVGRWKITVLHEDSQASRSEDLDLTANKPGMRFNLVRRAGTADQVLGQRFMYILIAALVLLMLIYAGLHAWIRPEPEKFSTTLLTLLDQAAAVQSADTPAGSALLAPLAADIHDGLASALDGQTAISQTDQAMLLAISERAETLSQAGSGAEAQARLANLRTLLDRPAGPYSIFWREEPLRFLEVFFWALAGVLVNKIVEVGSYLRWGSFFREGLPMHLSHLATIPILVMVMTLLLSMASVQLDLMGGNQLKLNLNIPALLAAVSFMLGSRFWSVWSFIRSTGDKLTGREESGGPRPTVGRAAPEV